MSPHPALLREVDTHTETHALPHFTRTHTQTETHTHTDIDTHTQRPTHCLNSLDLTLHTEHLTDNSHSDFLRDEKCFRATRRLVALSDISRRARNLLNRRNQSLKQHVRILFVSTLVTTRATTSATTSQAFQTRHRCATTVSTQPLSTA